MKEYEFGGSYSSTYGLSDITLSVTARIITVHILDATRLVFTILPEKHNSKIKIHQFENLKFFFTIQAVKNNGEF